MQKLNIETNAVLQKQEAPANIKDLIPDGAIYFE
jgi:hypothetical protein